MNHDINVFTTFNKDGYKRYGFRFLDSLLEYWPAANITVYTNFSLPVSDKKIKVNNLDEQNIFYDNFQSKVLNHFSSKPPKGYVIGKKTIKFSYKSFCISKELEKNHSGYSIWMDADTEIIKPVSIDFEQLLNQKFLACQMEKKTTSTSTCRKWHFIL